MVAVCVFDFFVHYMIKVGQVRSCFSLVGILRNKETLKQNALSILFLFVLLYPFILSCQSNIYSHYIVKYHLITFTVFNLVLLLLLFLFCL